PPESSG
ncbi:hypothetical protein VN97_g12895, partial [Penicillium thymicola]